MQARDVTGGFISPPSGNVPGSTFDKAFQVSLENLNEVVELLRDPRGVLKRAGVPIEDSSPVTVTISTSRRPGETAVSSGAVDSGAGGAVGLGVAFHHGACHWGIYLEIYFD